MNSKTDKLNELFQRWRQSYGISLLNNFNEDGISEENEEYWDGARRKVLFLLKDTNKFVGDFRDALRGKSWSVLGHWAYGLQNTEVSYLPPFPSAQKPENCEPAWKASAIMNLKKSPGKDQSNMEVIRRIAQQDKDFIKEEIDIIQPDIVVCGATFGIAKEIIRGLDSNPIDPDGSCFKLGGMVWINYCHPSARCPRALMYYGLMSIYQNYLRKEGRENILDN